MKKDIGSQKGQQQILGDPGAQAARQSAPPAAARQGRGLNLANATLGEPRAKLTLVEFTDYQ
jgi:hypothetical protein